MKVTTKIFLDNRRPKQSGLFPVKLRVTFNGQRKYYPLNEDMTEAEFMRITTGKRLTIAQSNMDLKFKDFDARAANVISGLTYFSFDEFDRRFNNDSHYKTHIEQSYLHKIQQFYGSDQVGTALNYKCAMNSLVNFKGNVSFAEVSPQYLKEYESWMAAKKKSPTTVSMYLRTLRTILNDAISQGNLNKDLYPFGRNKFEMPTARNIKKALSIETIGKIYNYVPPNKLQEKAKDLWVFSYLCNGLNIKDLALLRQKSVHDDVIEFVRAKTSRTKRSVEPIRIPLSNEIKAIINKHKTNVRGLNNDSFLFDILNDKMSAIEQKKAISQAIQNINKNMKRIASALGIKDSITCMSARHSFSTVLRNSGVSTEMIGEALGHSNVKTTQNYLASFEDDQKKEAYKALTSFKKNA